MVQTELGKPGNETEPHFLGWCLPPMVQQGKENRMHTAAACSCAVYGSAQSLVPSKETKACSPAAQRKQLRLDAITL